jgi:hypothetical protein
MGFFRVRQFAFCRRSFCAVLLMSETDWADAVDGDCSGLDRLLAAADFDNHIASHISAALDDVSRSNRTIRSDDDDHEPRPAEEDGPAAGALTFLLGSDNVLAATSSVLAELREEQESRRRAAWDGDTGSVLPGSPTWTTSAPASPAWGSMRRKLSPGNGGTDQQRSRRRQRVVEAVEAALQHQRGGRSRSPLAMDGGLPPPAATGPNGPIASSTSPPRERRTATASPVRGNSPSRSAASPAAVAAGFASKQVISTGATNRMAGSLHSQVMLQRRLGGRRAATVKTPLPLPAFYETRPKRNAAGGTVAVAAQNTSMGEQAATISSSASGVSVANPPDSSHKRPPSVASRSPYRLTAADYLPFAGGGLAALPQFATKRSLWTPPPSRGGGDTLRSRGSGNAGGALARQRTIRGGVDGECEARLGSSRPPPLSPTAASAPRASTPSVRRILSHHEARESEIIDLYERQREQREIGLSAVRADSGLFLSKLERESHEALQHSALTDRRPDSRSHHRAASPYAAPVVAGAPSLLQNRPASRASQPRRVA